MADIVHRVGIKAPPARVYAALSKPDGVAKWWTADTTGGSKRNEKMEFRFYADDGKIMGEMHAKITGLDKNKRVQWRVTAGPPEWIGTDIVFDLKKEGRYTIVLFGHKNWRKPAEFMAHCSMKWAIFMLSLKTLIETGKGNPAPDDIKIDNWN